MPNPVAPIPPVNKQIRPIPQDPIGENFRWRDWITYLREYIITLPTTNGDGGAQSTTLGSICTQDSDNVDITGGTITNTAIDGAPIGAKSPNYGAFATVRTTSEIFNVVPTKPSYTEGTLFYDYADKALAYYNDVNGITVNIGQELIVRVYNNTGSTILNGKVCYINGAFGAFPTVALAQADSTITSEATLGICTNDILDGEYGYITTSGLVHELNTSTYSPGDQLYLSATNPGDYTTTAPLQPNYAIVVGYVTESSTTDGAIYVHIDKLPWFPNGEIRLTAASTTLPTTPTVFTAPSVVTQQGISYDNATGVLTINTSGSFALSHTFNCQPSAANKKVYFYVEESTDGGSTWNIVRYSARQLELTNGTETQLTIVGSRYYATGTKIRYYLWGDATVTLKTTDLPGTTAGTVTLPAYRLTLAG